MFPNLTHITGWHSCYILFSLTNPCFQNQNRIYQDSYLYSFTMIIKEIKDVTIYMVFLSILLKVGAAIRFPFYVYAHGTD